LQQLELPSTNGVPSIGKSGSCLRSSASSITYAIQNGELLLIHLGCQAILFDMDGTLVDSTACVEAIWERWARKHGIDVPTLLQISHGRRTVDTIKDVAPHLHAESEAKALEAEEMTAREGIVAIDGAFQLLSRLKKHQWAVVTSASKSLAAVRLECAGLPAPPHLIGAGDVLCGKPDPEGYLKAADRLGVPCDRCVVVEDTPAGILAGRGAGMTVLALSTTFAPEHLLGALWASDFTQVKFSIT
jgi:sugar-phosphatase